MVDGVDLIVEMAMNADCQGIDRPDDSQECLLVIMRKTLTETEFVKKTLPNT